MRTLVLLSFLLCACASVGKPFDLSKTDQMQPGISTEADAQQLFGEPLSRDVNPTNNHELLRWAYAHASPMGENVETLAISFDENGKMLKIIRRSSI
jgi:hypothetical protein